MNSMMMILVMENYQQVIRRILVAFNKQIATKKKKKPHDYLPRIFRFLYLFDLDKNRIFFFFFLGSVISYIAQDKNIRRELDEYSKRLSLFVEKLQADLAERNSYNNHRTIKGKSKIKTKIKKIFLFWYSNI